MSEKWTYKSAGLDLDRYAETMAGVQALIKSTWKFHPVLPSPFPERTGGKGTSGFASLIDISHWKALARPILVNSTDGVGSKIKIAQMMDRYDTIGIDLVAMCVNDLICVGAEPISFLDYLAMAQDDPELTQQIVKGICQGCEQARCSLVGGETAILPAIYQPGDFDLAGFCTGVVDQERMIDGSAIQPGNVLLGLAASGFHSNGYTLIRKVVFDLARLPWDHHLIEFDQSVGELLLTPTEIYVDSVLSALSQFQVKGLANITGGGLIDNVGRILPPDCAAVISRNELTQFPAQRLINWLGQLGDIDLKELDKVFNNGVGFVVILEPGELEAIREHFSQKNILNFPIGEIVRGAATVTIK